MLNRLARELKLLETEPPFGIAAWPAEEDGGGTSASCLDVRIQGPKDTPYENGVFKLSLRLPDRYPFEPPAVRFITQIYHPNIDSDGRICLDSLKMPPAGAWQPSLNIAQVLSQVRLLLLEPNPDDPLMPDVTAIYKRDYEEFSRIAKAWTAKYAKPSDINNTPAANGETHSSKPLHATKLVPSQLPSPSNKRKMETQQGKRNDPDLENENENDDDSQSEEEEIVLAPRGKRVRRKE